MSEKQKEMLGRFEELMTDMTDRELENLLLVGEGMAIMSGIKEGKDKTQDEKSRIGRRRREAGKEVF